jgi:integrase
VAAEEDSMSYAVGVFDGRGGKLRWLVPGRDYKLPRPEGPLTLAVCFEDYLVEHCVPSGGDPERAWIAFRAWINALGCNREVATLTRADGRKVVEHELARGVSNATARKHLTMGLAALNHARKEERLGKDKVLPAFQMPPAAQSRIRWLTREEHRRLMLVPKPWARQMFWLLAFATGARTTAILELTRDRVDLVRGVIDFRVPGKVYRNKRRAVVPIAASLRPRLVAAFERADPACPFVVNRKGKPYSKGSLYHECKADLAKIGIVERGVARHVARHTVATWMLRGDKERGIPPAPIQMVAQFLGDKVEMIERVYAHVLPTDLQDATRVLH